MSSTPQPHTPRYQIEQRLAESLLKSRQQNFLQPTLAHRINRLSPAERHDVKRMIRSLTLRRTIRAVLREARLAMLAHSPVIADSPAQSVASDKNLRSFEPVITNSQRRAAIATGRGSKLGSFVAGELQRVQEQEMQAPSLIVP